MSMRSNRWLTTLLVVVFAGLSLACPDDEPSITVDDQTLPFDQADVVTIAEADIDNDGFVVIYDDDDGQPGDVMGNSELIEDGTTTNIEAQLDRNAQDNETLWAILHYDALEAGEFQRPDKQPQVTDDDGQRVMDSFVITIEDPPPVDLGVTIDDQTLFPDQADVVTVSEATIDEPGFVVIYDDDEGEPGEVIGSSELIDASTTTNFDALLERDAGDGEQLWGVLHYDETDAGQFEDEDEQPPVTDEDDQQIRDSFVVTIEDPPEDATINVSDQTLDELSTIVNVDEVEVLEDGWVAIHEGACDDPGDPIGSTFVNAGLSTDVPVELTQPAAAEGADQDRCAALWADRENAEVFDPAQAELVVDTAGDEVWDTFNVAVAEGTPAIRVTLDAVTPPAYTLENVEPSVFDDDFEITVDDEIVFQLRHDWRYQIDNLATEDHPFEFINEEDETLLSQDVDGDDAPLEDVESIAWVEDNDSFLFTVSEDFRDDRGLFEELLDGTDAVSAYHSAEQPNMMGPVEFFEPDVVDPVQ